MMQLYYFIFKLALLGKKIVLVFLIENFDFRLEKSKQERIKNKAGLAVSIILFIFK